VSQALRGLLLLVAAFLVIPAVYQLLQIFMPLIFMLIGVFALSKLLLGRFKRW
jgi:hypothetical protein